MSDVYKAEEARILEAISEYNDDENLSLRAAAVKSSVDRMTLTRRLDGSDPKSTRTPKKRPSVPLSY